MGGPPDAPRVAEGSTDDLLRAALIALRDGEYLQVRLGGASMSPFIRNGELARVAPISRSVRRGVVVICARPGSRFIIHRVIGHRIVQGKRQVLTKGDAQRGADAWWELPDVLGQVVSLQRRGRWVPLDSGPRLWAGWAYSWMSPFSRFFYPALRPLWRLLQRVLSRRAIT